MCACRRDAARHSEIFNILESTRVIGKIRYTDEVSTKTTHNIILLCNARNFCSPDRYSFVNKHSSFRRGNNERARRQIFEGFGKNNNNNNKRNCAVDFILFFSRLIHSRNMRHKTSRFRVASAFVIIIIIFFRRSPRAHPLFFRRKFRVPLTTGFRRRQPPQNA